MEECIKMFDKNIKHLFPLGLQQASKNFALEILFALRHQRGLWQAKSYRFGQYECLQLGCGGKLKKGWINVDLSKRADITLDLRRALPFPTHQFKLIYSEHFLEHIAYPEPVTSLVRECFRILKPGGIFSIVVPDIVLVMRSYFEGASPDYYEAQKKSHPVWCTTQMEHINYNFRQNGEHQFCYDMDTISKLLVGAGFVNVRRRNFDSTLDNPERLVGSLYVACQTPGKNL
jgi:predicted SAM-dependent methyltransferase